MNKRNCVNQVSNSRHYLANLLLSKGNTRICFELCVVDIMSETDPRLENFLRKDEINEGNRAGEIFSNTNEKPTGNEEKNTTRHVQELLQLWNHYRTILPTGDKTVKNIAAELCDLLVKTNSFDALSIFLEALPDTHEYNNNESIIRAKVHVALNKKDTKKVYKLIQEYSYSEGEDLIRVWDEAHYIDEERRTKKKLTPLSRFRVRKRHPPPKTICFTGVRKTNTLPRDATSYLKTWLMNHITDPYPSATEKQHLAQMSGLSQAQVKTWFANARRRSKNTEEFQRKCSVSSKSLVSPCAKSFASTLSCTSYENSIAHSYNHGEEHTDFAVGQSDVPACYEYMHPYNNAEKQGYLRFERTNHLLDPQPACNNARLYRPLDQSHCQYDTTARVLLDLASRGGYHHYEYPHGSFYYH